MVSTQEDVPEAKFKFNIIKDNTVADLKRWLACRALPMSGKEKDLIDRVQACIDNQKAHVIFVGIDNGMWWRNKCDELRSASTSTSHSASHFPLAGWELFPSLPIPRSFRYGVIQEFISFSDLNNSADSCESGDNFIPVCGSSKCMQRGRISFRSGHVQNIEDNTCNSRYYLRAKVLSCHKSTTAYNVHIVLDEESEVADSGCQCPASESKSCSHVIALLFMLEDYTLEFGFESPTSTSKLKEWNKGRKRGNYPQSVFKTDYSKQTRGRKRKPVVDYVPYCVPDCPIVDEEQQATNLLQKVQSLNNSSMWDFLLEFKYKNYVPSDEEIILLQSKVNNLLENITPSISGPVELKVEQNSEQWINERCPQITASECKSFFTSKDKSTLIDQELWSEEVDISNLPQIAYGGMHEDNAFQQYATVMGVPVRKAGFFIKKAFPGLGCSPDGLRVSSSEARTPNPIPRPLAASHVRDARTRSIDLRR